MKKVTKIALSAAVLTAVTAGTWFTAQTVQSPEQRRQAAEPPPQTRLTHTVDQGRIEETVSLTCTRGHVNSFPITPSGQAGKVITRIYVPEGGAVKPGQLLADVEGKPLIAIAGAFPLYRDITPESTGPDVDQLRQALASLGYLTLTGYETGTPAGPVLAESINLLLKDLGYSSAEVKETIPAAYFAAIPQIGGNAIQAQAGPGPAESPLMTIGLDQEKWLCTGQENRIPEGVLAGQKIALEHSPDQQATVELETRQPARLGEIGQISPVMGDGKPRAAAGTADPGPASSGGSGGAGRAGGAGGADDPAGTRSNTSGAAEGSRAAGKTEAAVFVTLPVSAGEKRQRATASVVVQAAAENSLIVPSSALWSKDGKTVVTVVDGQDPKAPDAKLREVTVRAELSVYGRTAVIPLDGGTLKRGDAVIVARDDSR